VEAGHDTCTLYINQYVSVPKYMIKTHDYDIVKRRRRSGAACKLPRMAAAAAAADLGLSDVIYSDA
jgi:hypothetical protein